jgi:hypothetical protein
VCVPGMNRCTRHDLHDMLTSYDDNSFIFDSSSQYVDMNLSVSIDFLVIIVAEKT